MKIDTKKLVSDFCELFGYEKEQFSHLIMNDDSPLTIEGFFNIQRQLYLETYSILEGEYQQEFHINRVCYAIENGEYMHKLSSKTRAIYRQYRKRRWKEEALFYGFRLRWQNRINRAFPNAKIRIPALDEMISHKILYFFSALSCVKSRISYRLRYNSLADFHYMDRRYGHPINVKGPRINYLDLFIPGKKRNYKETSALSSSY